MGVILGGNCPGGSYLKWEFYLVGVFRVAIVRGNHPGGMYRHMLTLILIDYI